MRRHADWIAQARIDLDVARESAANRRFEWACFIAQQSAEKAAKAVYERAGREAWGHGVLRLLETLEPKDRPGGDLLDAARELDRHYVPARYPNGFDAGYPAQYYGEPDARRAIDHAERILRFCESLLARP